MILANKPWLMTPSGAVRIQRENEKRGTLKPSAAAIDLVVEDPREMSMLDDNGIAHIHIQGVIGHRLDWFDKFMGNTDVCDVRREIDRATAEGAKGIFLRIDSPGGGIIGTAELGDQIAAMTLPIFAWSDSCCASAAYWLASSAQQIWTTETAEIGSIGVLLPWVDSSAAWQAIGIEFRPFTNAAAIYKSAGHGPGLTPEQEIEIQGHIERVYSLFGGFLKSRRPQLMDEAMQGQSMLGCDAPLYGLSDYTGTIAQAYSALCFEAGVYPLDVDLEQPIPFSFEFGTPIGEAIKKPTTIS